MKSNNQKFLFILRIVLITLVIIGIIDSFTKSYIAVSSSTKTSVTQTTTKIATTASNNKKVTSTKKTKKNNKPITYSSIKYKKFYDVEKSEAFIIKIKSKITTLNKALKTDKYTKSARKTMTKEVSRLKNIKTKVTADIRCYKTWESEYYYAAKTWEYFKQRGFNDAVVSGIIGNMMIETSGGTLALKPTIYNPSRRYYGLCQWALRYRPEVVGMSFEKQLDYLYADLEKEFNVFGKCYYKGFNYKEFIKLNDPEKAALAFAKVYERCGSSSYSLRKQAARKAYNYFKFK